MTETELYQRILVVFLIGLNVVVIRDVAPGEVVSHLAIQSLERKGNE
jgi:hypothetical protein